MPNVKTIFLVVFVTSATRGHHENAYSVLEDDGFSCTPDDTCSLKRNNDDLKDYRCQCGPECVVANSCCIDSPYIQYMPTAYRHEAATCQQVPSNYNLNVMMVEKCEHNWKDMFTKFLCEKQCPYSRQEKDPLPYVPVTSLHTKTTYKNYYCAICNNDDTNIKRWDITVQMSRENTGRIRKMNTNDLSYDDSLSQFVLMMNGKKEVVDIVFRPPENLRDSVALCVPDLVSDCAPDWGNDTVRSLCHAFMGVVFIQNGRYRNVYCAICNYVNIPKDSLCSPDRGLSGYSFDWKPPRSLILIMDVNWEDGEKVGSVHRCDAGNFYDPMSKVCRSSKCAFKGYVRNADGDCVAAP